MTPSILLISEENQATSKLVEVLRGKLGYHVQYSPNGDGGVRLLREAEAKPVLILYDMGVRDVRPSTFIHVLQQINPVTPVLMLARDVDEASAIEMIAHGALNYLELPSTDMRIKASIENALYVRALRETVHWLESGKAKDINNMARMAESASHKKDSLSPVHILDEHGEVKPYIRLEEECIKKALLHHQGQVSLVARKLRIGRSTLYRKMEQYQMQMEK